MRRSKSRRAVGLALAVLAWGCAGPPRPGDALDRETRRRLRQHVERLAADDMEGRGLGEPGLDRAIEYAVGEMQAAGAATERQPVPIVRYRYGPGNRLVLTKAGAERTWQHGAGMLILHPGRDLADVAAAAPAFVGYGISAPQQGWDDYAGLDVTGRLVFVLRGVPDDLPEAIRPTYEDAVVGPMMSYRTAVDRGAAGVVVIPEPEALAAWHAMTRGRTERSFAPSRTYQDGRIVDPARPILSLDREALRAVFEGSGYDPVTRQGTMRSMVLDGVRLALHVDAVREPFESANVVGLVSGTDPRMAGEIVAVSAHVDHLGIIDGQIHNGANDDASGCAVVLEIARRVARAPVARPVAFVLFTAEETHRLGSLHFLAEPPFDDAKVVAAVNLEHVGWSEDGSLPVMASAELEGLTRRVAERFGTGHLRPTELDPEGWDVFGNDGYSYFVHGVSLVIVENPRFPGYHTPDDDVAAIDFPLLADATAITEALVREIGTRGR